MKTTRLFANVLAAVMTAVTASTMVMTALAAGPASGEEYKWDSHVDGDYGEINADLADTKPTLSISRIELPINKVKENNVHTIELTISGANGKYSSTGFHIYFDSRLDLLPDEDGDIATYGNATKLLSRGTPTEDPTSPEGYKGMFLTTACKEEKGKDGTMWKFDVIIPENAEIGDIYPIELYYKSNDIFRNNSKDRACAFMETYLFTKGIEQGYIKITEAVEEVETVENIETIEEVKKADKHLGDIDGDNKVNSSDATNILGVFSALSTGSETGLTEEQLIRADVNNDKKVDSKDATSVLGYYGYTSTGGTASIDEYVTLN